MISSLLLLQSRDSFTQNLPQLISIFDFLLLFFHAATHSSKIHLNIFSCMISYFLFLLCRDSFAQNPLKLISIYDVFLLMFAIQQLLTPKSTSIFFHLRFLSLVNKFTCVRPPRWHRQPLRFYNFLRASRINRAINLFYVSSKVVQCNFEKSQGSNGLVTFTPQNFRTGASPLDLILYSGHTFLVGRVSCPSVVDAISDF